METIRRELEEDYVRLERAGRIQDAVSNPAAPWDSVFLAAAGDEEYWSREVKEASLLYTTNLKAKGEITDDGHHAPIAGNSSTTTALALGSSETKSARERKKRKERIAKAKARDSQSKPPTAPAQERPPRGGRGRGAKGRDNRAKEDCWAWTKYGGCSEPCPQGRKHPPCPRCGGRHPWRDACPAGAPGAGKALTG